MHLGHTYSHRHIQFLGIDIEESFDALLDLEPNYIRLCGYWDEIEKNEGEYTFEHLDALLDKCKATNIKVVMSLGAKAPRYPEFYFPDWILNKTTNNPETFQSLLKFLKTAVTHFKKYDCISHWQVENEPLDEVFPNNNKISLDVLKQEIALIRTLDTRKIVVNLWGNDLTKRGHFESIKNEVDIVGLDLYFKQHIKGPLYRGPKDSLKKIRNLIEKSQVPVWISELQAEPWEDSHEKYLRGDNPSFCPELMEHFFHKVSSLPVEVIFFWGYEYWYYRKMQGDERYFNQYLSMQTA